jgi:uncharacterized membrane protein
MFDSIVGVSATTRLVTSLVIGVVVGALTVVLGTWEVGLLVGWMTAAAVFGVWMWVTMWPMDAEATAGHALGQDAGRTATDLAVLVAAVASLGAVGLLLVGSSSASPTTKDVYAALCVGSVALAWGAVHTLFTARYARLYYSGTPGGVSFNEEEPPSYRDFAYLAFTIGMTFQVSDTALTSREMRANALRQALLSYLFGTVIIASVINLVAGLSR